MSFQCLTPDQLEWTTRPHEPGEPARHTSELSERLGSADIRAQPLALSVNHGDEELVVYAYGYPPESERAELLDSAL